MLRFARLFACFVIAISLAVILYGGYALLLTKQMTKTMAVSATNPVKFTRVRPFMDGVVIDTMQLGHVTLASVYFEGYPWQILQGDIKHIYIKQAKIRTDHVLAKAMIWPFDHQIPLTVERMVLELSLLGKDIVLNGEMKQAPNIPLLFKMSSISPELTMDAIGEVRVQDHLIQSIDVEFRDAQMAFDSLETKRSGGWLSMTFDDNLWNIVGEMDSGFVKIPQQSFFDMTVKLNGTADEMDFTVSGNDQESKNAWVIERMSNDLHLRYLDHKKTVSWNGFNNHGLHAVGGIMTTFAPDVLAKEEAASEAKQAEKLALKKEKEAKEKALQLAKQEKELARKKKIEEQKNAQAQQDADDDVANSSTDANDEVQEKIPLVYAPIQQLVGNSVFQGFLYNRPLVVMPRICVDDVSNECWIARGQGGVFGYDTTDPWKVPSYFSRLQNYQEATQLRGLLASLTIDNLVLNGDKNGVRDMIIHGKDTAGRNIHIELSVLGLSAD